MRRLVVKLVLTILVMPAAMVLVVFGLSATWAVTVSAGPPGGGGGGFEGGRAFATALAGMAPLLVVGGWALVWRRHIRLTPARRLAVGALVVADVLLSVLLGAAAGAGADDDALLPVFLLQITGTPALAVLIWRNGPEQERQRLRAWMAAPTAFCPYCEGNLVGRRAPLCPYCGGDLSGYTLAGENP
ncbi:MAG: zinc ribbon domain-containing protein [Planctomycetes bacterium]|nr:zinc ribbon domain-containing protein [Planctomycetota bacterium]